MAIEKKVTLPILGYYDSKIKEWVGNRIDDLAQADWAETDPFASGYIKNKPEGLISSENLTFQRGEGKKINNISVLVDGKEISNFFSGNQTINAEKTIIVEEATSFFTELNTVPTYYNGLAWDGLGITIDSLNEEEGPYLIITVFDAEGQLKTFVKSLKIIFAKYATKKDLEDLRTEIKKDNELEII